MKPEYNIDSKIPNKCAWDIKLNGDDLLLSCFTKEQLKSITKSCNENSQCSIDYSSMSKKKLFNALVEQLKAYHAQNKDLFIANNVKMSSRLKLDLLKRLKPYFKDNQFGMLYTEDINAVCFQLNTIYTRFNFCGAFPSDILNLYKVRYGEILAREFYDKIAWVLNTDDHTEYGTHWVVVLVSHQDTSIEYFDSLGRIPNNNILLFIKKLYKVCERDYNTKYKIKQIGKKIQNSGVNCGVYSIRFIVMRCINIPFENVIKDSYMNDTEIEKYKSTLFSNL